MTHQFDIGDYVRATTDDGYVLHGEITKLSAGQASIKMGDGTSFRCGLKRLTLMESATE